MRATPSRPRRWRGCWSAGACRGARARAGGAECAAAAAQPTHGRGAARWRGVRATDRPGGDGARRRGGAGGRRIVVWVQRHDRARGAAERLGRRRGGIGRGRRCDAPLPPARLFVGRAGTCARHASTQMDAAQNKAARSDARTSPSVPPGTEDDPSRPGRSRSASQHREAEQQGQESAAARAAAAAAALQKLLDYGGSCWWCHKPAHDPDTCAVTRRSSS